MTSEAQAVPFESPEHKGTSADPTALTTSTRARILIYLGVLIVLIGFGAPGGGLIDIPVSFFLKNKLHLTASAIAGFRLIAGIPLYLSFLFGFTRDVWSPLRMRDRGYFVVFGGVCAAIYLYFAFTAVSYATLLAAVLLLTAAFLFVSSAFNGLIGTVGQQHLMSGQVSTVFNIVSSLPVIAALVAGGLLSDSLEGRNANQAAQILFLAGAAIMASIALYGVWKPRFLYDNIHGERGPAPNLFKDIGRLLRHWPIYPALMIWLLWNFAPGSQTPLQFYLQNTLHSNDAAFANWNALFAAGFIPTFLLYGWLCQKFPLKPLLWWGTVVAVPQMVPLLFMHTPNEALIAAVPIGLMGGVSTAAYTDLLIRSCPRGLQGTTLMLSGSLYAVAARFGDILGTNLYQRFGGFSVCVIAITVVYALILPTLLLVPDRLIVTRDGEAPEGGFAAD